MITLDIFGPQPNKKQVNEAVTVDRSKVHDYPRDPATVQHRIDTAKAILADPNSDPDSRRVAAAILAQHKGVAEGSKMARADKLAKAPKPKNQQEYDAIEKYRKDLAQSYKPKKEQGVAEGSIYKKDQDLSSIPTQELEAFVKKHWGGGVPTYGQGESVKRAMRELRRRQKQGVAEGAYDIRRDPTYQKYNPETHTMMYKDGKHKAVKHSQVAKARELGWKVRHSLKAFYKGQGGVAEADKHSFIGKIQRGHELKKKVDQTWKDIGDAQKAGDKEAGSRAFRKHERYANLERPGTWTKVKEQGVAEGFGSNYAEQLAQEVFNHNPNIKDENQVLNLGYNISKNDLGRKAQGIFRDEDFPSDFVSAYFWLQKQGVAKQPVNEISPHDYDSDEDYYAALRGRRRPSYNDDYDYDPELDQPQDDGDDESYYEKYVRTKNLEESVFLKEDRQAIYEQWNKVGKRLVEYKLTSQQVQNIFTQVEKASTAAGGNRTMVGRGVDKATELNNAWEGLKDKIQQSHPVKGFDDLYDKAAAKLKQATGGDQGVMQYINKYRAFAKEHPYIQSAVYAALIAAAGLSGAGLGGAGALGLLKMTDRLLQGDKASSALYKGAKTGALAYGASQLAQYFKNPNQAIPPGTPAKLPDGSDYVVQKGDTLSQIAQKNGVSVKDLMQANSGQAVPTGDQMTWNQPDQFGDVNAMGDAGPSGTGAEQTYDVRTKLTNPDVLKPGQKLHIPGSLGPTQTYADNVGTAADTWDKVKSGAYSPSEISRNQAAKWNLPGAGEYRPTGGASAGVTPPSTSASDVAASTAGSNKPELTPKGDETNYAASKTNPWEKANAKVDADVAKFNADAAADAAAKNAKASAEYSDWLAKNPGSPVPYDDEGQLLPGWVNDPEKPGYLKFNAPKLKESQIFLVFDSAVAGQRKLNEGIWDTVKGAAGKAADWAKTKGHNITTKVTLDKLLTAWNKSGKPTDSAQLEKLMLSAGVAQPVIDSVYASMKIPKTSSAPAQQTDVYGRQEPTMTAPAAKATPATTQKVPATAQWNYASAAKTAGVGQPAQPGTTAKTAQAGATPSWADPKSSDYVGRREVARRMAAQPQAAKAATPAAPQWGPATGAYSTQAAKQQPGTKPVATPAAKQPVKPGVAQGKLTPQQYIQRINPPQLPEEANKKKDNDDGLGKVHDVALQRAISKSKAAFPTAQSGVQALMKSFAQDQDEFEKVRRADRRQDQLLAQISQVDKEQEKELQDLDNQNNTLAQRLQQLQSVNSKLEKQLAAMSGRKSKDTEKKAEPKAEPKAADIDIKVPKTEPKTKSEPKPAAKAPKVSYNIKSVAPKKEPMRRLRKSEPGKQAFAQITPQLGTQSPQHQLFPTDYGHDTANLAKQRTLKDLKNLPYTDFRMLKNPKELEKVAQQVGIGENNNKEQEANYGDEYQDMVARVGQKAREQEKKKPVDIKDLARRLAGVKLKDEK